MNKQELIKSLQSSSLFAECPKCGDEFKLSDATLFDGSGSFPAVADAKRKALLEGLSGRVKELERRTLSADKGSEKKAIEVGFGKIIEKIVPAHKDFKHTLSDCRPLFEPIDMIVFHGATDLDIRSVTFLEIKTGNARVSTHERMIRDAVEERKVSYRVI